MRDLEHKLPISQDLRPRLLAWAQQHYRYDGGERSIDMSDFDTRGLLLSRELPAYSVQYSFTFAGSRCLWSRLIPAPVGGSSGPSSVTRVGEAHTPAAVGAPM